MRKKLGKSTGDVFVIFITWPIWDAKIANLWLVVGLWHESGMQNSSSQKVSPSSPMVHVTLWARRKPMMTQQPVIVYLIMTLYNEERSTARRKIAPRLEICQPTTREMAGEEVTKWA